MLLIRSAFKPYALAYFCIFSPTHVFGTFVNSQVAADVWLIPGASILLRLSLYLSVLVPCCFCG